MAGSFNTSGLADRMAGDPFNASIGRVGFVVHRQRAAGWSIRRFANERYDILALAVAGRAHYVTDQGSFEARRGTMLFFPRGAYHAAESDPADPWSFYSVGFELMPADADVARRIAALPIRREAVHIRQLQDGFEQLRRAWNGCETGFSLCCRGTVLTLMQQFVAMARRGADRVRHAARLERIIERMHRRVGQVDSVADLARQAGLSESRFRCLFRELTGCSVTRYQNRLRIQAAQDLLAGGQLAVGQVAEELGFRDVYYFSRLFKRFTGAPPTSARRT